MKHVEPCSRTVHSPYAPFFCGLYFNRARRNNRIPLFIYSCQMSELNVYSIEICHVDVKYVCVWMCSRLIQDNCYCDLVLFSYLFRPCSLHEISSAEKVAGDLLSNNSQAWVFEHSEMFFFFFLLYETKKVWPDKQNTMLAVCFRL